MFRSPCIMIFNCTIVIAFPEPVVWQIICALAWAGVFQHILDEACFITRVDSCRSSWAIPGDDVVEPSSECYRELVGWGFVSSFPNDCSKLLGDKLGTTFTCSEVISCLSSIPVICCTVGVSDLVCCDWSKALVEVLEAIFILDRSLVWFCWCLLSVQHLLDCFCHLSINCHWLTGAVLNSLCIVGRSCHRVVAGIIASLCACVVSVGT